MPVPSPLAFDAHKSQVLDLPMTAVACNAINLFVLAIGLVGSAAGESKAGKSVDPSDVLCICIAGQGSE